MCACVHVSMHVHVMHHVHVHVTMHCLQAFGDDFNLLLEISKNELIQSYVFGRVKKKSLYQTKMVPPRAHAHMLNCAYRVSWLHVARCMLYVVCSMLSSITDSLSNYVCLVLLRILAAACSTFGPKGPRVERDMSLTVRDAVCIFADSLRQVRRARGQEARCCQQGRSAEVRQRARLEDFFEF